MLCKQIAHDHGERRHNDTREEAVNDEHNSVFGARDLSDELDAALNARTDSAAIAEGDFALMEQGRLKLSFLPQGEQLLSGDTILTSGLQSGGTAEYPAGLVIGYVEAVRSDESGMSDYAILTPATRLDELEQVFVIKSFEMTEK